MTVRGSYLKLHWKIWLFIVPDKITFLTTKSGFRLVQLNCFQRHLNSLSITWLVNSGFFTQKLHRSYSINLFFIALIPLVFQMLATTSENNWFCKQYNSSARASRFLVHFFDVPYKLNHCTYATWNLQVRRFMEDVNIRRRSPCPSLNLDIKNWYNSWRNLLHLSNWSSKGRKLIFLSDVITVVVTGNSGSVIVDCEQPLGMVVCYTAVFWVVTQRSCPLMGRSFSWRR